jgi:osmotically-inducible protein OsmY
VRDHALERMIADALAANPRVDDDTIAVACFDGGHVVLRGSAESPAEATRALRTAERVAGVRDVEEQLRLRRRGMGHRADARTEAAVLKAFITDDVLPAEAMHVSASDGTVTLSGLVDFPFQRDEAEAVATRVRGVSALCNHLSVWMAVSPNEVLERVTDAIGEHGADQLTVTSRDNVVTLSGTARSAADRDAAVAAAAAGRMVVDVVDEIRLTQPCSTLGS